MKKNDNFSIRPASRLDAPLILSLINELASYEKLQHQVTASVPIIEEWIFDKHKAEVIIAELDHNSIGFALYFYNFSTFVGKSGLYLEDLFIRPQYRGNGYGKALFLHLADIALEKNCGRFEWICLDWNQPSIDFYLSMGAVPMSDWTVYRIGEEQLRKLSKHCLK